MSTATAFYLLEAAVRDAVHDLNAAVVIVDHYDLPDHIAVAVRALHRDSETLAHRIAAGADIISSTTEVSS